MTDRPVCPECGKSILGRTDKRFCSEACRTAFHNRVYRERRQEINFTNRILLKNYFILRECFEEGMTSLPAYSLYGKGFNFNCITSILGKCEELSSLWVCCYTYAYTVDNDGNVLIRYIPEHAGANRARPSPPHCI